MPSNDSAHEPQASTDESAEPKLEVNRETLADLEPTSAAGEAKGGGIVAVDTLAGIVNPKVVEPPAASRACWSLPCPVTG